MSKYFGSTINEIKKEKFSKIILCNNLILSNNQVDVPKSINKLNQIFSREIVKSKIDSLILLGDRYELLPVSTQVFQKN